MTRFGVLIGAAAVFVTVAASPLLAHDVWVVPSDFRPESGERLSLRLFVGHGGEDEALPRRPHRIDRFYAKTRDGEIDTLGQAGMDPAGFLVDLPTGPVVVVYRNHDLVNELEAEKFERYLEEEGLDDAIAYRSKHGEQDQPGRERYGRSLKSLLWVGEPGVWHDRPLGLDLELVVESDLSNPDGSVTLRLYSHGEPVSGSLVDLRPLDRQKVEQARTDADGRVRFVVDATGTRGWVAAAITTNRLEKDPDADWQSEFTTLTFLMGP